MKRLNVIDKVVFLVNSIAATMLLLSYVLPYVSPKSFAFLSVLSLAVPILIICNILFVVYWLLKVKKQLFLSLIVLGIGYSYVFSLYKFSSSKNVAASDNISIMNYNVRLFNLFEWIPDTSIKQKLIHFISEKNPDILSLQEYHPDGTILLEGYFKYEKLSGNKVKNGQAIFSKYPIINSGSIDFPNTSNNAIYVDIVKGVDTVRVYNVHLESLRIDPSVEKLSNETSQDLSKRVSAKFKIQQSQTELFLEHKIHCPYKMIVCGDFNNTAYSYVYKEIKGKLQDAFVEAGNGFGRTFNFRFFPVRIDFILVDDSFDINSFKTFDVQFSDHYPIMAKVKLH